MTRLIYAGLTGAALFGAVVIGRQGSTEAIVVSCFLAFGAAGLYSFKVLK